MKRGRVVEKRKKKRKKKKENRATDVCARAAVKTVILSLNDIRICSAAAKDRHFVSQTANIYSCSRFPSLADFAYARVRVRALARAEGTRPFSNFNPVSLSRYTSGPLQIRRRNTVALLMAHGVLTCAVTFNVKTFPPVPVEIVIMIIIQNK